MTDPKTPAALSEWIFCTEHEIVVRSGICRLCNGDRNLIQVVPKSQLAAATERVAELERERDAEREAHKTELAYVDMSGREADAATISGLEERLATLGEELAGERNAREVLIQALAEAQRDLAVAQERERGMREALAFLTKLHDGGQIVSSGQCSYEEIAIARGCSRFYVDAEHFGYVYRPKLTPELPKRPTKIERNLDTPEGRAYWASVEKSAGALSTPPPPHPEDGQRAEEAPSATPSEVTPELAATLYPPTPTPESHAPDTYQGQETLTPEDWAYLGEHADSLRVWYPGRTIQEYDRATNVVRRLKAVAKQHSSGHDPSLLSPSPAPAPSAEPSFATPNAGSSGPMGSPGACRTPLESPRTMSRGGPGTSVSGEEPVATVESTAPQRDPNCGTSSQHAPTPAVPVEAAREAFQASLDEDDLQEAARIVDDVGREYQNLQHAELAARLRALASKARR